MQPVECTYTCMCLRNDRMLKTNLTLLTIRKIDNVENYENVEKYFDNVHDEGIC